MRRLTYVSAAATCLLGVVSLLLDAAHFQRLTFLLHVRDGISVSMADVRASDQLIRHLSLASTLLALVSGAIFLAWVYRAHHALRDVLPGPFRYTPGFCVGCFFIPFANFVLPYSTMRELWRPLGPGGWRVTVWWSTWMVRVGLAVALMVLARQTATDLLHRLITQTYVALAFYASSVLACVAVVVLMLAVSERQERLAPCPMAPPAADVTPPRRPASETAWRAGLPAWYVHVNGVRRGPLSEAGVRGMAAAGQVGREDLVWREGWPEWRAAGEVGLVRGVPHEAAAQAEARPAPGPEADAEG